MRNAWARLLIAPSLVAFFAIPRAHAAMPAEDAGGGRERTVAIGVYERQDGALRPITGTTIEARVGDRVTTITSRVAIEPGPSRDATEPLLAHPWRLVIYVDPALLTADGQQRSMDALARHAGQLTALGTVEVVIANPAPITTLEATRGPQQVARALRAIGPVRAAGPRGPGARAGATAPASLAGIRRRFQIAAPELGGAWNTARPSALEPLFARLRQAAQQEEKLLTERLGQLSDWLLVHPAPAPAAVIWPTSGWDTDPANFYLAGLESDRPKKRPRAGKRARQQHLPRVLAERSLDATRHDTRDATPTGAHSARAMRELLMREMPATGDLGEDLARDMVRAGYVALPLHATSAGLAPQATHRPLLLTLAQATGSRVALSFESVTFMLDDLRTRQLVTLRLPENLEQPMPLLLTTGHEQQLVKAPRWLMPRSPALLARGQALALHADLDDAARRSRGCKVERRAVRTFQGVARVAAELSCRVNTSLLTAVAHGERSTFLELVVTEGARDAPRIVHQETIRFRPAGRDEDEDEGEGESTDAIDLAPASRAAGRALRLVMLETLLMLSPETQRVGLFVRLGTDERGSSRAVAVVDGATFTTEPSDTRAFALGSALAAPAPLRLVPLDAVAVAGRTPIEVQIFDRDVDRVVYRLDGAATGQRKGKSRDEPTAIATQAPFRVWLDLPDIPTPMTLRATALDADGKRLGEDRLALNQRYDRLRVAIREPTRIDSPGQYEVAIEVDTGLDQASVDLFWNDRLLTALHRPPYRALLDVPAIQPGDFLRAAVRRGPERAGNAERAEDVVVVGREAYNEEIPVSLIELYTVVEDRHGLPIAGLDRDSFQIYEDRRPQTLTSFADASETPLTVALALDVSDSMGTALPWVKKAARSFVRDVLEPTDQAMLIAFDQRPALRLPTTADTHRITTAIDSLDLGPGTALHDTVVFGLLQLRAIAGRKALVVLTDGVDQHSNLSQSAMLASARRAGIPIYILRMRDPIPTATNSTLVPLRRMAKRSGAGIFRVDDAAALARAYDTIARELRSQYLLTYHSDQPSEHTGWREIEVHLASERLRARTIPGYEYQP